MRQMLTAAGFTGTRIEIKENAADIIKGWMPGSGAEKYITSAYVTAVKSADCKGVHVAPVDIAPVVLDTTGPVAAGC